MTVRNFRPNSTTPPPPRYLLLFICLAALSIYLDLIPLLREFNFDVVRMVTKMAKHPMAWINWGRVIGLPIAALIIWIRYRDDEWLTRPALWLVFGTALVFGIPEGILLLLYLRQRQKEQNIPETNQ